MTTVMPDLSFCAGFFSEVADADRAIAGLLAAGFTREEIGVVCPENFKGHFPSEIWRAKPASTYAPATIASGGAIGAALGGLALAATTIVSGGAALLPGALVLVGGGAIAGSLSNLIVSDGYHQGLDEYYAQAVDLGKIAVGVQLTGGNMPERLTKAAGILAAAGASPILPENDPASRVINQANYEAEPSTR